VSDPQHAADSLPSEVSSDLRTRVMVRAAQLHRRRRLFRQTFALLVLSSLSAAIVVPLVITGSAKANTEAVGTGNQTKSTIGGSAGTKSTSVAPPSTPTTTQPANVNRTPGVNPSALTYPTSPPGASTSPGTAKASAPPATSRSVPTVTSTSIPQASSQSSGKQSGGINDSTYFIDQPTGTTASAYPNSAVNVVLSAPESGTWGTAVVSEGASSILTISGQMIDSDGSITVWANTHVSGTATISVPCVGNPALSWSGTVQVGGQAPPDT
jgi:hypothetical protein